MLLGACGGNDGTTAPPPPGPTANTPPVISSAANTSIEENASGIILTVTASDADGDTIMFSLSGPDAGVLSLNAQTGDLSLLGSLDFEAPIDADTNNLYEVTITAADNRGGSAMQNFQLTVTDLSDALATRTIATGLSSPVQAVPLPGDPRLVIVQQGGLALVLDPATGATASVPFLDVTADVSNGNEQGLLGLAFSPDFVTDRRVFVNLTNTSGDTEIRAYQVFSTTNLQIDPSTEDIILTFAQPFANHNAGWIGFTNDGDLLIPTGDGGSGGDPFGNAQDVSSLLGKVLRIDVSTDAFPADPNRDYAIPLSNPFATSGGAPEIFAVGLRNPFRASYDAPTGDIYIGDVGQNAIEEISRIPRTMSGLNFGWNLREGSQPFNGGANSAGFTPPLIDYPHGSGPFEGNSILGGVVYRGPIGILNETYIFADTISNNIWFVPLSDFSDGTTLGISASTRLNDFLPTGTGSISTLVSIDLDQDGNILLTSLTGTIIRIELEP